MGQSRELFRSTAIYTIGNFGSKILTFLLLPFFSFYLSREELGIYDIVVTTVSFFVPFVTLQVSSAVYRWLLVTSQKDETTRGKTITSSFYLITTGLFVFHSVYHIISFYLDLKYSLYISILIITSSYLPFFQNVIRGLGLIKLYSFAGLLNASLLLALNFFFLVIIDVGLEALFLALIISNTLTILIIFIRARLFFYFRQVLLDRSHLRQMLNFSIPLIPNTISWWLINGADKFLILLLLSSQMNGIYAISSRFPTILLLFNSVFLLAWQDHTITAKEEGKSEYDTKIFDKYINFQFSIVLILISVSEPIIRILVDNKFYEAYKFMPLLFLGVAFSAFSGYFGAAFLREKRTKGIFTSSIAGGILNIIITYFLLSKIGLYASALGTFLSFSTIFIFRIYQSKTFFKLEINYKKIIILTIISLIFSILVLFNKLYIHILLFLIAVFLFIHLNKELILKINKSIRIKLSIT